MSVRRVTFSISRPSEYTRWRPRVERTVCDTAFRWGVFSVVVER